MSENLIKFEWFVVGFVAAFVLLAASTAIRVAIRKLATLLHGEPEYIGLHKRAVPAGGELRWYPSWIAGLAWRSPTGLKRWTYVYRHLKPGIELELRREPLNKFDHLAVAYYHHGNHVGYVPRKHHWVAEAMDEGHRLSAIVHELEIKGLFIRRATHVRTAIWI